MYIFSLTAEQLTNLILVYAALVTALLPVIVALAILVIQNVRKITEAATKVDGHAEILIKQNNTLQEVAKAIAKMNGSNSGER